MTDTPRPLGNYLLLTLLGTVSLAVVPLLGIFMQGSLDGWTASPATKQLGVPDSVPYLWDQWWHIVILGIVLSAIVGPAYFVVWRRERRAHSDGR